jgi:glycogen operon protein
MALREDELKTGHGRPLPLGATLEAQGVNFSLFARRATSVTLELYDAPYDAKPALEIPLDRHFNRTGDIWHCFVRGLRAGAIYLYRIDGPWKPEEGLRFNVHKRVLDPYAKAVTDFTGRGGPAWNQGSSLGYDPRNPALDLAFNQEEAELAGHPKAIVIDNDGFDWQGDVPLNYPLRKSVLYETHIKGLTANPNSGVAHPGTYLGVVEKIPYLKDLGVTSLEFLPLQEFNENEFDRTNPRTGKRLTNYWGYSTMAFFAPKGSYSTDKSPGGQVAEFKTMVRELHKAGLEVILDIVFNHTAEGNERGLTFSFRGIENSVYYILSDEKRYYQNYSGCGNTVNCNHPVVRTFILDCLHYWVVEMHVDGFRFDLGSILGRDQKGRLMENPPVLERIAEDPILASTKLIAEAWDAGGAYQVGRFPGGRWAEWNDRFRDDVRRFWRGDPHVARDMATRLAGSADLYLRDGRKPFHSIDFVTSHDGFTLRDLVSYNGKHNEENGEDNRDGNNNNLSSNYGVEGETEHRPVLEIRRRQIKNFIATMMVSLGTPMLLGGDEMGRSQHGNNNAYCQDNETSWYDWALLGAPGAELYRFARLAIRLRLHHLTFMRPEFYTGHGGAYNGIPDITWYDEEGASPDWNTMPNCLALRIDGSKADVEADRDDNDFFIMLNSSDRTASFTIPECAEPVDAKTGRPTEWALCVDTGLPSPNDILEPADWKSLFFSDVYYVKEKSMVILVSRARQEESEGNV